MVPTSTKVVALMGEYLGPIDLPTTKYADKNPVPDLYSPHFVSMFDDIALQVGQAKRQAQMRREAMSPILHTAGQSEPSNGGLGHNATPNFIPEILSGTLYSCSI